MVRLIAKFDYQHSLTRTQTRAPAKSPINQSQFFLKCLVFLESWSKDLMFVFGSLLHNAVFYIMKRSVVLPEIAQ